ncbi:hypothetical protein [Mycolicibacterium helvum]|uniref:Uncharacterized protein n=2 Tax=Mycolicibacterium helvum TaxID=1534349 RepID=A0A7I7T402_9MYCO|nr:hypothetical protein [Mycolicibacterium helvum]BBY62826.1 hypothetical protein MHEL_10690 [Mycolicibacterium helvum]
MADPPFSSGFCIASLAIRSRLSSAFDAARRSSSFPVHAALATALSGQWDSDPVHADAYLHNAIEAATSCGLTRIIDFARELLNTVPSDRPSVELFYP